MKMVFDKSGSRWPLLLLLLSLVVSACGKKQNSDKVVVTREMLIRHNQKLVELETDVIRKYLEREGIEMEQSTSGLWYRFVEDAKGPQVLKGQVVYIDFKLFTLDGTLCYASSPEKPKGLVLGQNEIETGLDEALAMSGAGDSLQIVVPPYLAFGLTGDGDRIPGQSVLRYDIRVLHVENNQ